MTSSYPLRLQLEQIKMALDYQDADLAPVVATRLNCRQQQIRHIRIVRRALDARSRTTPPCYNLTLDVLLDTDAIELDANIIHSKRLPAATNALTTRPVARLAEPPVVVGTGPAGLMAAWHLAQAGLKPVVLERGEAVETRKGIVRQFWRAGVLNPECNVLYGEGGAGLFSDGKLTSRSKDRPAVDRFLQILVNCGAPPAVRFDAGAHLGSDMLTRLVKTLRQQILAAGADIQFNTRLTSIQIKNNAVQGIVTNRGVVPTQHCILATGHSARDVYGMLQDCGVALAPKALAVGLRLELPQPQINLSQWGAYAFHPRLGAASFSLTWNRSRRPCYTFCMCPGGRVIPCASTPGQLTTNGMSYSRRAQPLGNAAFLVPVTPADILSPCSTAVNRQTFWAFQEEIENKAFIAGGRDYGLPVARLGDFLKNRATSDLPARLSWKRVRPANLHAILPLFVSEVLVEAIPHMLKKCRGVHHQDVVLYGAETRSSSPLRILRRPDGQSENTAGLYPCGEGAGYAGGIVSSAVDGIRAAEAILRNIKS